MFLYGITSLEKIVTEDQRILMRDVVLSAYKDNVMGKESEDPTYKESYGVGKLERIEPIFDSLTATIEDVTKLKLKKRNTYSRIYFNEGRLGEHVDRPGLELTLSVQVENTTGRVQAIHGENYQGGAHVAHMEDGDGLLIKGGDLAHWRDDVVSDVEGGHLICVFFHWEITSGEYLEHDNLLSDQLCRNIIQDAENTGFKKSTVLQNGETVEDPHYRNSSTLNIADTYGIRNAINAAYPMFKDMIFEGYQLVKYDVGETFRQHFDCLSDLNARYFTVLLYLNEDFDGGLTIFNATGDVINPKTGKMLIWKNVQRLNCNPRSMHTGSVVERGTKYVIVTWVRRNQKPR